MNLRLREFSVAAYRSLRQITVPVSDLDVFVGGNGVGKTNLYRALELVRSAAANTLGEALAAEGMASAFWAGARRAKSPAEMRFAVALEAPGARAGGATWRYEVVVGFPSPASPSFELEPQIKEESLTFSAGTRRARLMERKGPAVMIRDEAGRPAQVDLDILASETVLGRLEDPSRYPDLDTVRRTLLGWRFYHDLRTDPGSPLRAPCAAVATPTLASDGANLAAVFATLAHIRQDTVELDEAIERAFPGARLVVPKPQRSASFGMAFPEFPGRVFEAAELSDGVLRFLGLAGALLAYRLPQFVALNEPEASLHTDLMTSLSRLVIQASERSQVWLVTHSQRLAEAIGASGEGKVRLVTKTDGATGIAGLTRVGAFADEED